MVCSVCGLGHEEVELPRGTVARCVRCDASMGGSGLRRSLHLTAAFSLAAMILYVPANLFPIMRLEMYGAVSEATAWDGARRLFRAGDVWIGIIVFLASIVIPLVKLIGLFVLVGMTYVKTEKSRKLRAWMARAIDVIGRWAMLDVFVVAILVSLVKLQSLATIRPGEGVLAFTGVVVCTLIASASFDSRLIWEGDEHG